MSNKKSGGGGGVQTSVRSTLENISSIFSVFVTWKGVKFSLDKYFEVFWCLNVQCRYNMKCDLRVTIDSKSENRTDQTIRWLLASVLGTLIKIVCLGIHCVQNIRR